MPTGRQSSAQHTILSLVNINGGSGNGSNVKLEVEKKNLKKCEKKIKSWNTTNIIGLKY